MTELTSRLTFGYHLTGKRSGYGNLLGSQIVDLRAFLNLIADASKTSIQAVSSSHKDYPALSIRIEGSLGQLEEALTGIIEHEGNPDFVVKPRSNRKMNWPYLDPLLARFNLSPATPTTPDAYNMARGVYKERRVSTISLDDNTLVPSSGPWI